MSISPPSDIILDVAQAADPQRVQAATARLAALASGAGAPPDFGALLAKAAGTKPPPARADAGLSALLPDHAGPGRALTPYQKFEAVLLQSFVQEILPKDDQLYGDAASSDAYRGMMAEQLAAQLARSGRIGIAKMIEKAHGAAVAGTPASGGPVAGTPAVAVPAAPPAPAGESA